MYSMKQIFTTDYKDLYKIHFDVEQKKKNFKIMNICACDTETSSAAIINGKAERLDKKRYKADELYRKVWDNAVKISILYMWQFGIFDKVTDTAWVFWGRDLNEFREFLEMLEIEAKRQALNSFKPICRAIEEQNARNDKGFIKIVSYVHNLPFDFQILRNIHNASWSKHTKGRGAVFAREKRRAMKAVATVRTLKIEYRDSLVLVNMSLAKWGQSYKLPVCKIKVDEDFYLKIRTPKTPLTQDEIDYGCTDIVTLMCGIQQFAERYGTVYNIPLTQAGTARQSMIAACAINPDWMLSCYEVTKSYGLDLFKIFVKLQDGGYVHANSTYVNKLLDSDFAEKKFGDKGRKIYNFDYSSDYPYCACVFKHPIGQWLKLDPKYFDQYASVDVLESKIRWFAKISCKITKTKTKNSFWSLSHVLNFKDFDGDVDNGRIRSSKNIISLYIADVEWDIFSKVYEIEDFKVEEMYGARAGRMCNELIEWILDRYCAKTELKREDDDPEYEETLAAYNHAKVDINAGGYGVFVTKVLTPGVDFGDDGWRNDRDDESLSIDAMYEQTMQDLSEKKTFTQYPIGIWITKWAKWRLWSLLIGRWFDPLDRKAVYMDTDSMKGFFTDKDLENINEYNKMIESLTKVKEIIGDDEDGIKMLVNDNQSAEIIKLMQICSDQSGNLDFGAGHLDIVIKDSDLKFGNWKRSKAILELK